MTIFNAPRQVWLLAAISAGVALGATLYMHSPSPKESSQSKPSVPEIGKIATDTLKVSQEQVKNLNPGPVVLQRFVNQREAIGMIDFNQDKTVQVFTAYQGRIAAVLVKAGDDVKAGQILYTVNVPDLVQAGSNLISTAGVLRTANETLRRAKELATLGSIPQKELDQNQSDQQTAEANYKATRKALGLFGLSEADINQIEKDKKPMAEMPIRSPLEGRVTARNATQGALVQPGVAPAPVTVSDMRHLWMVASVPESELADYRIGQALTVVVPAYPGRRFVGKISYIGDTVDPVTHRLILRADLNDAAHVLRQQMLANFNIDVGTPVTSQAVPLKGLARESDGSYIAWVTTDGLTFSRRAVQVGVTQDGMVQVTAGLKAGEVIARESALFLSNLYNTSSQ